MRSVQMIKMAKTMVAMLLLALLAGLAAITTGCDDGAEADMYAQMTSGGLSRDNPSGSSTTSTPPSGTQPAGEIPAGLPGSEPPVEEAATEEDGEVDRSVTLVPGVDIQNVEVKAPYPEFTGADRYDVKVTLVTESPVAAQVFTIMAIGFDGEVVGSQERDLRLPRKKAGILRFDDWYCKSMPETVEFHLTDVQSATADASTGNVEEGRGGSSNAGLN